MSAFPARNNAFSSSSKLPDRTNYNTSTQQSFAQSAFGRRPEQAYQGTTQAPAATQYGTSAAPVRQSMEKESHPLSELTAEQREECNEAFQLFDLDRDKYLNYHELRVALRALGFNLPKQDITGIMKQHGTPASVNFKTSPDAELHVSQLQISQAAFLKVAAEKIQTREPAQEVERAFHLFDHDRKGYIVLEDLRRVARELGETGLEEDEMKAMIEEFDFDGQGYVTKETFYAICLQ